jgi:hypothetical protein
VRTGRCDRRPKKTELWTDESGNYRPNVRQNSRLEPHERPSEFRMMEAPDRPDRNLNWSFGSRQMRKAVLTFLGIGTLFLLFWAWRMVLPPVWPQDIVYGWHPDGMQVVISCLLFGASLFVILSSKFGPKDKAWAYATPGMLFGFWLRPWVWGVL